MSRHIHPNRRPQRRERLWNTAAPASETPVVFASGTADRLGDLIGGEAEAVAERFPGQLISPLTEALRVGDE